MTNNSEDVTSKVSDFDIEIDFVIDIDIDIDIVIDIDTEIPMSLS